MTGGIVSLAIVLLLLALALWAVLVREAFLAIAGFVAYGLLLSLVWVRLHGIDVALTEAAIGGGLTGAMLIGAVSRLRGTEAAARAERSGAGVHVLALLLSLGVAATLALCVLVLPDPAPTLAPQVSEQPGRHRRRQPDHRRAAGLPRAGHAARSHRAGDRADRRVVAGAGPLLGRPAGLALPRPTPTASWPTSRGCCRRWASSSPSTSSGPAPTIRAASSRAPPSWRRCGCWC